MQTKLPLRRRSTHPLHVQSITYAPLALRGARSLVMAPLVSGPAGPVGPVGGTDHPYAGMDPSDPLTWTRPYNPQPGMIAALNFDGAMPNKTQTGPNPKRKWWQR